MKIKISGLPKSPKLKIAAKCLSQTEEGSELRKPCSDANTKNACEYMNRCHTYNDQFIGNTSRRQSSISKHPVANNASSPSASLNAWSRSQTRNNDQKEEEEHEESQISEPYSMLDFNQTSGISIYEPDYYKEQQSSYNLEQPSYHSKPPSYTSEQPSDNSEQPSNTSQHKNGRGNLEFTTRTIPSTISEKTNDRSDYSSSSNEISQDEFTRPKKANGPRYELSKLSIVDDTPYKRTKRTSTLVHRAIQTLNRWSKVGPAHGFKGALMDDTQDTTEPSWKADKGGAFNPYENDAEKEDTDQLVMNDKYLEGTDDIPYPNTSAHTSFDNLLLLDDGLDTSYEGGYNGDGINSGKPRRKSVSFWESNSKQSLNSETTSIKSKEHSKSSRKRKDTAYATPVGGSRGFDSSRGTSSRDKSRDLSRVVPHREPLPSVTTMSDQNDKALFYLNLAANSTQQYPDCKSVACAEQTCSRCRFEPSTYAQYCGDRLQCKRACCRSCHDFDPYREDSSSYQVVYSSDSDEGSRQSLNSETTSIKSREHSKSSRKRKDTAYAIPVGGSRGFDSSRGTSSRDKSRDLSRVVPHREPLPSVTTVSDQNDKALFYLNKASNSTHQYPDCKRVACAEPTCSRCRFEPPTCAQYCGDRLQCKRACCRSCHDFDPYREDSSSYQGVYSSDSDEGSSSDENDYVCDDCSCAVKAKKSYELCSCSKTDECQDCCCECECDCLVCAAARELAEKLKNTKIRTVRINHND